MDANLTEIVNAVWPIFVIAAVFTLCFSIFSIIASALRTPFDLDDLPAPFATTHHEGPSLSAANGLDEVTLAELRTSARLAARMQAAISGKECRYCGTEYEGKKCPQCGGPRK